MAFKMGLLEFGYLESRYSSIGKISDIADYVVHADELGFTRFWLAEHHHYYSQSTWSNPQFLLPILLNMTEKIRIGMAGILINYYSPYEVAMNFKLIANLFPDRVDLGFANGTLPLNVGRMLGQQQYEKHPDQFYEKIKTLAEMYHQEDAFHERENMIIPPFKGLVPDIFMLSSSRLKFEFCIQHKLHCAHSLFHDHNALDNLTRGMVEDYKADFFKAHGSYPAFILSFKGICADTQQNADVCYSKAKESIYGSSFFNNLIVGTADVFNEELAALQHRYGVDEFVYLDCNTHIENKKESLRQLAEKINFVHA